MIGTSPARTRTWSSKVWKRVKDAPTLRSISWRASTAADSLALGKTAMWLCMCVCVYVWVHTCTSANQPHLHWAWLRCDCNVFVYVCVFVCLYVCVCVCVRVPSSSALGMIAIMHGVSGGPIVQGWPEPYVCTAYVWCSQSNCSLPACCYTSPACWQAGDGYLQGDFTSIYMVYYDPGQSCKGI